jgi:hypothetical protein
MEMIGKYLIYGLVDPRDGQLRYIGKSAFGMERPRAKHATYCRCWEKQLENLGMTKKIVVIQDLGDECDLKFLSDVEIFWIAYFRKMGARLTNMTDGGDGISNMSREIREKISLSKRGKPSWNKGKRWSEESKHRMSQGHLGVKLSESHRKGISEGLKTRSHEVRVSAALKAWETRRKKIQS